jgi:hypothetical protein
MSAFDPKRTLAHLKFLDALNLENFRAVWLYARRKTPKKMDRQLGRPKKKSKFVHI